MGPMSLQVRGLAEQGKPGPVICETGNAVLAALQAAEPGGLGTQGIGRASAQG